MSQTAILTAIASIKKQMAALENLVAGNAKNLASLPPLPQSEAEGDAPAPAKPKAKKNLSPERLAYLKSDEHKAKLQAGLAAYRAKKAAEKAGGEPAPAAAADSSGASDAGSSVSQKRRGPKKLSEMTPEELEAHKAKVAERKAKKAASASAGEE
jgi:hypothetical protein